MIPSFPTKTFPNHYTLATGLHPGNHGLVNNTFYAPDLDLMYRMGDRSAVENGAFYGGEPIWVTASKQGLITGFVLLGGVGSTGEGHAAYLLEEV
jgi:predicted AlkP superfamily pyrophosphatase or phosphodiesterase